MVQEYLRLVPSMRLDQSCARSTAHWGHGEEGKPRGGLTGETEAGSSWNGSSERYREWDCSDRGVSTQSGPPD